MSLSNWSTKIRVTVALVIVVALLATGLTIFFVVRKDSGQTNIIDNALIFTDEQTNIGDYDSALDALKDAQSKATSTDQKLLVLTGLAAAAANAGQLTEALGYYAQKHQLDPSTAVSDGYLVGELYERLGETQKAIEQFERYLHYLKDNPPAENAQAKIDSLSARIQQMKEMQ